MSNENVFWFTKPQVNELLKKRARYMLQIRVIPLTVRLSRSSSIPWMCRFVLAWNVIKILKGRKLYVTVINKETKNDNNLLSFFWTVRYTKAKRKYVVFSVNQTLSRKLKVSLLPPWKAKKRRRFLALGVTEGRSPYKYGNERRARAKTNT